MNHSSCRFRGHFDSNQVFMLCPLSSCAVVLLMLVETRAATFTLRMTRPGSRPPSPSSSPNQVIKGVPPGGPAGFAISVRRSQPLTCQWYSNNAALSGQAKDRLLLANTSNVP